MPLLMTVLRSQEMQRYERTTHGDEMSIKASDSPVVWSQSMTLAVLPEGLPDDDSKNSISETRYITYIVLINA